MSLHAIRNSPLGGWKPIHSAQNDHYSWLLRINANGSFVKISMCLPVADGHDGLPDKLKPEIIMGMKD